MKVLGLISGGKDSIYNLIKCIEEGHEIVALGNLYNQDEGVEMDSYMYQTVGTNMSIGIAQCLNKTLIRKQIKGKPKITNIDYFGDKQGDQVEDLYELVKQALKKFPEINAISSGAIFSTYQKLRVQNVCQRFKIKSLAYLWHREQSALLKEMIQCPIRAIIIKVASYGMNKTHLGKTIEQLCPYFQKLKGECEMNVCGEGGEYESLVLDCPIFKKRIVIDQMLMVEIDKNELAPVAYLKICNYHLEDK